MGLFSVSKRSRHTLEHVSGRSLAKNIWLQSVRLPLVLVAVLFAIIGSIFLYQSFAANANLPGDVNNDNIVNLSDLSILLSKWNTIDTSVDLNNDNEVGLSDLSILLSNWNKTYTPIPPTPPPVNTGFVGPLKVSANNRYLIDQSGKPFFMSADTSWSLLTKLSVADAKQYIDLRKAQGYNTIMTNIVFPSRIESGAHGTPFRGSDMTKPNESYFMAVDEILNYAKDQGVIMYVGSFWKTDNGGACISGFPVPAPFPSDNEMRSYASYLGSRYSNQTNLIWFNGGDGNPECMNSQMANLGNYMKAAMPNILISYHTWGKAKWTSTQPWLGFNSMQYNSNSPPYSYADIRDLYGWSPTKPAFNMEPAYDPKACCGSDQDTSEQENRRSGWWAALSGALGVAYGGPRAAWFTGEVTNRIDTNAINRNGARHTGNINKIMSQLKWHLLEPDWNNATVTGGRGTYGSANYATAARASDGSLIIAYTPQAGSLTVNLAKLAGAGKAQWYDPTTGNAIGSAMDINNSGSQNFVTPGNNNGGNQDWVLIVKR